MCLSGIENVTRLLIFTLLTLAYLAKINYLINAKRIKGKYLYHFLIYIYNTTSGIISCICHIKLGFGAHD